MRVIHKFGPFGVCKPFEIKCRKLVHFGTQNNELYVWAEIDIETETGMHEHTFLIVGTGMDYEIGWVHQMSTIEDGYVWHCLKEPTIYESLGKLF